MPPADVPETQNCGVGRRQQQAQMQTAAGGREAGREAGREGGCHTQCWKVLSLFSVQEAVLQGVLGTFAWV